MLAQSRSARGLRATRGDAQPSKPWSSGSRSGSTIHGACENSCMPSIVVHSPGVRRRGGGQSESGTIDR